MGVLDGLFPQQAPAPTLDGILAMHGADPQADAARAYAASLPPGQQQPGVSFAPASSQGYAPDPNAGMTHTPSQPLQPSLGEAIALGVAMLPVHAAQGLYGSLSSLPALGRQLANEPIMTSDPTGAITDTGGVQGSDTAGVTSAAGYIGGGGFAAPKPAGAIGIFGGRMAKTADLDMHDLAAARDTLQGTSGREDITSASTLADTGWFKGADDNMRFEIPDHGVPYRPGAATVGEALDHPALFAAYPHLADMPIHTMPLPEGELGSFGGDHIKISDALAPGEARVTLLHELQHAVQAHEGFARGGNAMALAGGMDAYNRLAGEVEARNVETRSRMDDGLRAAIPPWATESVRRDKQMVSAPSILDEFFGRYPPTK